MREVIEAVWLEMFRLGSTAGNRQQLLPGRGWNVQKKKKKKFFCQKKLLSRFFLLSRFSGFLEQRMGRAVGLHLQLVLFLIVSDGCWQTLP